jgi:hypothetical protein
MTLYLDTKPELDWVYDRPMVYAAQTSFCTYEIHPSHNINVSCWIIMYNRTPLDMDKYDTLSEAKAAAQADYQRRTAERFRKVEVPKRRISTFVDDEASAYNDCIDDLQSAIAKATEAKP